LVENYNHDTRRRSKRKTPCSNAVPDFPRTLH